MPVHPVARYAFWVLLVLSMTNAIGLYVMYMRNVSDETYTLGAYPAAFFLSAGLILAFSRRRHKSTVWLVGWAFWAAFLLGGFLGPRQITAVHYRAMLEVTIKPWIAIIGVPWMAMRAVSQENVPRFLKFTVLLGAIGGALGLVQIVVPGFLQDLSDNSQRATGFWMNPNTCGVICALTIFISLLCPFRFRALNWVTRLLLLAGVATSFSRTAVLALVIGWIVYGVASKKFWTLLKSLLAMVLFIGAMFAVLEIIEAASPIQAQRLAMLRSFLEGDWGAHETDNRTELWQQTFHIIESQGGLIFGLGHGSMLKPLETAEGQVAPHNYYLAVLGNSGIFALLLLLVFEFALFHQAWKCKQREVRAALLAMATIIALDHMFDHSMLTYPFAGVILACMVLAIAHSRATSDLANPRRTVNPLPPRGAVRAIRVLPAN
jgi:hypothetical protein